MSTSNKPEIPRFKSGTPVCLKSDFRQRNIMTVESDSDIESPADPYPGIDELIKGPPYAGGTKVERIVRTVWLNSQAKIETGNFKPELLQEVIQEKAG